MSKEIQELFEYRTTPYFSDSCGHGGYLFSFTTIEINKPQKLDVYCFDNNGIQEFCLRYGSVVHEYISPGIIEHIIAGKDSPECSGCWQLLKTIGKVEFKKNESI